MVNIISMADSKRGAPSTGNIYFLLTNLDFTGQDLMRDNKLALLFSQEQSLACSGKNIDAMEPTCARIMISGQAQVVSRVWLRTRISPFVYYRNARNIEKNFEKVSFEYRKKN